MAHLNPYLSFKDSAQAALEFYAKALGGKADVMTFRSFAPDGKMGPMTLPAAELDLVMHGQVTTPGGLMIMAADTGTITPHVAATSGNSVALTGDQSDQDYITAAYEVLKEGADISMPFEIAPWGDKYGMLTDKFGISWMFDVANPK